VLLIALPQIVMADARSEACEAIGGRGGAGNCRVAGDPSLTNTVRNVINILSVIVGIAAVIMVILGGFRYVTSGGDSNSTKGARDTIIYALVGLVVVALAQAIVQFVLQEV
jgi:hypothetical protein